MRKGDFSKLANDYKKYRPSYNKEVVEVLVRATNKEASEIIAADVGAGTGIFTKCLIDAGVNDVTAVEPNDEMREAGKDFLKGSSNFVCGSAEKTNLKGGKYDLVTMASSFHWPKTITALTEFDRILKTNGIFSAVWNPRLTQRSASESEVEELLTSKYRIKARVSSGLSGITEKLREILTESDFFSSVIYVDAVDIVKRTHAEYIGAWRSVNDIQVELGRDRFSDFLADVETIVKNYPYVEVHYLTRAWIAMK